MKTRLDASQLLNYVGFMVAASDSKRTPAWAIAADVLAVVLLAAGTTALLTSDMRLRLFGVVSVSLRTAWRPYLLAVVVLALRNWRVSHPLSFSWLATLLRHVTSAPSTALRGVALAGAVAYALVYVGVALARMRYPFELEWLEGYMLEHVKRVVSGQLIYEAPSLDFVAFLYPPLYYYVSAIVARIVGVGFFPLRLVSFAASLGLIALIYALVARETRDRAAGVLAAGLFAATYRAGGAWLDVARVDTLFLTLSFAAVYLVRTGTSHRRMIAAGMVLALAVLTKQTALILTPVLGLYLLVTDRPKMVSFGVALAVIFGVVTLVLEAIHGPWYDFYIFRLPAVLKVRVTSAFWTKDILGVTLPTTILAAGYLISRFWCLRDRREIFYPILIGALLAVSWTARSHVGGYDNALLPAYAGLAVLVGLTSHRLARATSSYWSLAGHAVYLTQLAMLMYSPSAQIPTVADRAVGEQLVQLIAATPGEVYVPRHPYLSELAGKRGFAQTQAITDILDAGDKETKQRLSDEVDQAYRERRFQLVIIDGRNSALGREFKRNYVRARSVVEGEAFWPVTGAKTRPEWIYEPRPPTRLPSSQVRSIPTPIVPKSFSGVQIGGVTSRVDRRSAARRQHVARAATQGSPPAFVDDLSTQSNGRPQGVVVPHPLLERHIG